MVSLDVLAVLVSLTEAAELAPNAVVDTVKPPATVFAVMVSLTWPLTSVVTVVGAASVALAPLPPGTAAKVTLTPGTRLPYWSVTVATRGLLKAVFTVALWPEPEVTVMCAADAALGAITRSMWVE